MTTPDEEDLLSALDFEPEPDPDQILRQHLIEEHDQYEFQRKLDEARHFDKEYGRVVRDDQRAREFLERIKDKDENKKEERDEHEHREHERP